MLTNNNNSLNPLPMEPPRDSMMDRNQKFTKSGQNKIPIGMRGDSFSQTHIRDKQLYQIHPKANLENHPKGFYQSQRLNSKGAMHDFRVTKQEKTDNILTHKMTAPSVRKNMGGSMFRENSTLNVLQPILENNEAQAAYLKDFYNYPRSVGRNKMTSSRRSDITNISDPDNGILFLDDDERIKNPQNQKTPPPPMWGDVLEEDLYDHS